MPKDEFFRTYSPRQEALTRAAMSHQEAKARPAAATTAPGAELLNAYRIEAQPYYRTVSDEVALYEAAYSVPRCSAPRRWARSSGWASWSGLADSPTKLP